MHKRFSNIWANFEREETSKYFSNLVTLCLFEKTKIKNHYVNSINWCLTKSSSLSYVFAVHVMRVVAATGVGSIIFEAKKMATAPRS